MVNAHRALMLVDNNIVSLVLFHPLELEAEIAKMAHAHGALVLVDNNIISKVLSHPLELRADIVVHSTTMFISGYSDLIAGVLSVKGERPIIKLRA
ncbi:hypothetical protein KY285_012244 [Solanum tuberosum]|nr:hypothetical protein KY285_012244 [Solanum tuberosum]